MKIRPARSFEKAIQFIIARLGEERAAEAVGRSTSLMRKWSDQDNDALPSLKQALALDRAFIEIIKEPAPIRAAYNGQLEKTIDEITPKSETIGEAYFNMQLAVGGVTRLLADLMLQHKTTSIDELKLSPVVKELLLGEIEKLNAEITDLEDSIRNT